MHPIYMIPYILAGYHTTVPPAGFVEQPQGIVIFGRQRNMFENL